MVALAVKSVDLITQSRQAWGAAHALQRTQYEVSVDHVRGLRTSLDSPNLFTSLPCSPLCNPRPHLRRTVHLDPLPRFDPGVRDLGGGVYLALRIVLHRLELRRKRFALAAVDAFGKSSMADVKLVMCRIPKVPSSYLRRLASPYQSLIDIIEHDDGVETVELTDDGRKLLAREDSTELRIEVLELCATLKAAKGKTGPDPSSEDEVVPSSPRAHMKGGIFICYRRTDSRDITGRVYDWLIKEFGSERVFMDVDSVPAGKDYRQSIEDALCQSKVLLAVIGSRWHGSEDGDSRLTNPEDYVRIELESALDRDVPVIPVLLGDASLPTVDTLPPKLERLPFLQSLKVRGDEDFRNDVLRLISGIRGHIDSADQNE